MEAICFRSARTIEGTGEEEDKDWRGYTVSAILFGLGQGVGPSVAGALADATGSFGPAFLLAAGVAFLGGVGSLLLRPPRTTTA